MHSLAWLVKEWVQGNGCLEFVRWWCSKRCNYIVKIVVFPLWNTENSRWGSLLCLCVPHVSILIHDRGERERKQQICQCKGQTLTNTRTHLVNVPEYLLTHSHVVSCADVRVNVADISILMSPLSNFSRRCPVQVLEWQENLLKGGNNINIGGTNMTCDMTK